MNRKNWRNFEAIKYRFWTRLNKTLIHSAGKNKGHEKIL